MLWGTFYGGLVGRERGVLTSNTTSAMNYVCDLGKLCTFSVSGFPPGEMRRKMLTRFSELLKTSVLLGNCSLSFRAE